MHLRILQLYILFSQFPTLPLLPRILPTPPAESSIFTDNNTISNMTTDRLPNSLRLLIENGHLTRLLERGPCLLFSRHSDRPSLPPKTVGPDVSLTANGMERARRLGRTLKELNIRPGRYLVCSPIVRNMQTLREICSAAGWNNNSKEHMTDPRVMGPGTIYEPGVDVERVVESYHGSGFGSYDIFNSILKGNWKSYFGVRPYQDGVNSILDLIKEYMTTGPKPAELNGTTMIDGQEVNTSVDQPSTVVKHTNDESNENGTQGVVAGLENVGNGERHGLSIMVSHDLHLAYVLAKMFGVKNFSADDWPPFLDSILFQLIQRGDGTNLIAVYGNQVAEIDTKDWQVVNCSDCCK
jgi:hypothetical protein